MDQVQENKDLFTKLKQFCEINEQFCIAFKAVEKQQNLDRKAKNDLHVNYIAIHVLSVPQYFDNAVEHFANILPRLVSIATHVEDKKNFDFQQCQQHVNNCILLGKLIRKRPDLVWYATKYCESLPSPFSCNNTQVGGKKRKMANSNISDLEFVEACFSLLQSNPTFYRKKWNWSEFISKYFNHSSQEVQWIACQCIAIVFSISEKGLINIVTKKMSLEQHEKFTCKYDMSSTLHNLSKSTVALDQNPCISIKKRCEEEIIEISGIYIPKLPSKLLFQDNLIIVDSTYNNLRKIALGLTSNKAICLQGPVGCGKTTLVEYLASKTGRQLGGKFVKVQLGDQTDSKMLLGTYRCTDIPVEFVWQPGVITQAVIEGNWLLLEDIDSASVDIASVLSSLLENGTLTVPGYRDSLHITPGFQLFFTQRLITTITGNHKVNSPSMQLLEKHLLQINITPLLPAELKRIIIERHPQFKTIADRMISVFHLFSSPHATNAEISLPKTSRLISTRDFFKWCSRSAQDFDVSSQASALKVLQDAIDVFCCSYPKIEDALNLAREISTNLGIINQKAEYFFKNYKPTMKLTGDRLIVGRGCIPRDTEQLIGQYNYFFTRPSAVLLERIMCCVNLNEPVLLVGETGTGKTSSVQYLANAIGQKLIVINMNQQSDSADLLGGYKPVDLKFVINPIRKEFEHVFCDYFKVEPNKTFLGYVAMCFNQQRWSDLVKLMQKPCESALTKLSKMEEQTESNRQMLGRWLQIAEKLHKLSVQLKQKSALAFAFIEGSLVKAVERGYWVLLDEINLANAETLECLSGLLEDSDGSLCLLERGDKQPVKRHKNFTLFACMNPSTDVGKKDLPAGLRNRFTEFYVDELTERSDLILLVGSYLDALSLKDNELNRIVDFYLNVRRETETTLTDGLGHRPHFSLRSLCRALMITAKNPCGMFKKSLYEAFCLSFLTQLDSVSYLYVEKMIAKYLVGDEKQLKAVVKQPIPQPRFNSEDFVQFEGYWVRKGSLECSPPADYVLTKSVRKNLKDLVRIVSIGHLPVLLQGDTSVGKTSLITYLAKSSGNKCVRINNHEHTDLQEYIGSYMADSTGKLVFREGLLVEAMRKGHWIILDELNLAPTDVLEALNRVLDDNRELFIPETQETVKADANFMLFATQNPPGSYGGRKMLSRAFRNRFVELHFNEIPPDELEFILHKRCEMAPSYAAKMIKVMTELQMRRRGSAAFAGKKGFITLRDLFRWGERYRLAQNMGKLYDWDQHLADEGYLVLAGRVRRAEEKKEIVAVLEKYLKRSVDENHLFGLSDKSSPVTRGILEKIEATRSKFPNIVWTYNMRQLCVLVAKAFQFKEPVLLVGETGGGKTTVCKLIAEQNGQQLATVNCHMHTESSDFIGGLRPVRHSENDEVGKLFEWMDGPLIHAMLGGDIFLADEISLADDSVLERLNSLLEPERTLLLAEKGGGGDDLNSEVIKAHENFYFIGTMNPGGDFGKKELSPALRNRFTEIWCEACTNRADLIAIIERNIVETSTMCMGNQEDGSSGIGTNIMDFIEWFQCTEIGKRITISIRDILTWVDFINKCCSKIDIFDAYWHGACLTFLDGLGSAQTANENGESLQEFRVRCEKFLLKQIKKKTNCNNLSLENQSISEMRMENDMCGICPFFIACGNDTPPSNVEFAFNAPTTLYNTLRLLRGMQLNKAILLEGSPGVGKTSLVSALAKFTRHKIFRVNLSDQTDISDLFGADLPVEGGGGGQFSWRDGPLLQALKQGHWILLDELNLASQSVLEGLNACLDHRGEIFIPELGKTFHVKQGTRFFACQNPLKQGGSRRGLPQSFLNRFIQVYVTSLTANDFAMILSKQFPNLPSELLRKMLEFNAQILSELDNHTLGNKGSPWEFNLRDVTRWCEAMIYHYNSNPNQMKQYQPECVVQLIYGDRMRTVDDKVKIARVFSKVFGRDVGGCAPTFYVNKDKIFIGDVCLSRQNNNESGNDVNLVLRSQLNNLRSLAYCVNLNWMSILVGGSAAGKSTIVRVLANLAGKSLKTLPVTSAMDTTDILGGFEQTDYARHLDEIVRKTEKLIVGIVQSGLAAGKWEQGVELLYLLEEYWRIDDIGNGRTMEDETKLFMKKCHQLQRIWSVIVCPDQNINCVLKELQQQMEKIINCVKTENSLNSGGKFEWVDSILIKCLQDGSWLLVDNVNLCSAAVLDRLNALLEPNGVLTVSERGVDKNGRMVEIKPHPDFRLFLAMDPKNGEISRAMRNRGVEIYMLNDTAEQRNDYDVKSLISRGGVRDPHQIEVMLKLHDFISNLMLSEKPATLNEMLRASHLIAQQIRHGDDVVHAFNTTLSEVYCANRSPAEFNCNDFPTVIRKEIENALNRRGGHQFFTDTVTLKTDRLQMCSSLEKIKQQCTLLEMSIGQSLEYINDTVGYFFVHFYSISSRDELHLRHFYLNNYLEQLGNNAKNLQLLSDRLYAHVVDKKTDFVNYPLDGRWIPDTSYAGKNQLSSNLLVLALHYVMRLTREGEDELQQMSNSDQVSLCDYMRRRQMRKIDDQFDNDVLIDNFLELMDLYNVFVLEMFEDGVEGLEDEQVVKTLELLMWRFILYRCTMVVNVRKINSSQKHLIQTSLKVHYRWFFKYALTMLMDLFGRQLPNKLQHIVNGINKSLANEFSILSKFAKIYQKHNNSKPLPQVSHEQIEFVAKLNETIRYFNICDKANDAMKIFSIFKDNANLRTDLIQLKVSQYHNRDDIVAKLAEIELASFEKCQTTLDKSEIDFILFIDHFAKLNAMKTVTLLLNNDEVKHIGPLLSALLPIDLITSMMLYNETRDVRLVPELEKAFFNYLSNAPSQQHELAAFHPNLIKQLLNLLIDDESSITPFGKFRQLTKQHNELSMTLWRNCQQLHDESYDFIWNEWRIIRNSFIGFVKVLALSLNLTNQTGHFDRVLRDECLAKLTIVLAADEECSELTKSLLLHLRNCFKHFDDLNNEVNNDARDFDSVLLLVSQLHMELSYVRALLNSHLPLIDPSAKKALKKKYCLESLNSFRELQQTFAQLNRVFSASDNTMHSHHKHVGKMLDELEARNKKLGSTVAVRPTSILYEDVVQSVNHGFATILSPKYINRIVSADVCDNNNKLKKAVEQRAAMVSSFENLICEWSKYRSSYPDVIELLLSNVTEFLYGFKLNLSLLQRHVIKSTANTNFDVQEQMLGLVRLPALDQFNADYCQLIDGYGRFCSFIKFHAESNVALLRLAKCAIQESFNYATIHSQTVELGLNKQVFMQFENLIRAFVELWNQQEKEREQRAEEAEALYKTKIKCNDKSEEEQIADELKELFPNYHELDFADMQQQNINEKIIDDDNKLPSAAIRSEDIKFVIDLHLILLQTFTKTEWLNPAKNKDAMPNFIDPHIEKFKLFGQIFPKVVQRLDYRMDAELVEGLSVLLAYVQHYGDSSALTDQVTVSPTRIQGRRRYDFYKDGNVDEAKSAFHILEELRRRTVELLEEWPDQPTLKSISTIIERVYTFDVSSPLSRFLTAFEILLNKCQEWEEVAHAGVSLSQYSHNLIQQIIVWRKLELNVWKDLLNVTFERMNEPIYKWWLFLYNIMEQFVGDGDISNFELIESLQNYISKSNLAEFQMRLNLLHAFHCHAVHLPRTTKSKSFINILWNVYCYFEQFTPNIINRIKDVRAPIEKKLKDYVKIVKWKDINYWAIKETVDKSHKTLHKYVREYQDGLRQPVTPCLVNTTNTNQIENVGIWDRPQRGQVKTYHYTLEPSSFICTDSSIKQQLPKRCVHKKLAAKIDGIFNDSRKLCKESMSAMKYPKLIQNLDGFVTEIIETSAHLQGLEVDTSLDKKKQKAQGKSILQQKHRALADLFKTLTKIGLSYRSGIVQSKLKMMTDDFLMKPIDIGANFSHISYTRKNTKILTIWDSCEVYYVKSLMRADVLDTALKTPAPDLGLQNIERCRGFSSNLLSLVQKQKAQLKDSSITFYYLRHYATQMGRICEARAFLPLVTIEQIEQFIKNITITTSQTKMFLNCCPNNDFTGGTALGEIVMLEGDQSFMENKNDPLWIQAMGLISDVQSIANKIGLDVEKARGDVPAVEFNLVKLNYIPIFDVNKFEEINGKLNELSLLFGKLRMAKCFKWLSNEAQRLNEMIQRNENEETSNDDNVASRNKLEKLVKSLAETISKVIQSVAAIYSGEAPLEENDEDSQQLEEEHLRRLLVENLQNDIEQLNMVKILDVCHKIANVFFKTPPCDETKDLIVLIVPLLKQLILFYEYILTQQVSSYRTSCKLSSILLNIFIDLASKGFCVPPEMSDEESGEGMSKPTDGMGLGEGEGERDVSDKIESEDQLDDAQPAGKEKEQEEDPDCREEDKGIEMSDDFDSKLQDIEKKGEEDESDEEDNDSDADEQMGDTENGADRKDKENFGSDEDEEEEAGEGEDNRKEEKGEGGEKEGESELAANEKDKSQNKDEEDQKDGKEKEEKKKEINEMEEPEFDDDQVDPYHGNQPELPEPEAMDLPDDLQLDDGQENENEGDGNEENPFDIDAMKEDNPFEDQDKDKPDEESKENDEVVEYSSEDEDLTKKDEENDGTADDNEENQPEKQQPQEKEVQESEISKDDEDPEEKQEDSSGLDQTQSNEEHVEAMEVEETSKAADKTQANQNQKSNSQTNEDLCQEDKPDKDGMGQSQMEESSSGHSAQTTAPQQNQNAKREREEELNRAQKPGDSDSQRSLGNVNEPIKKKLKTMNADEEDAGEEQGEDMEKDAEAEMYKHIKESKESSAQILDVATKEQAEKQQVPNSEDEKPEDDQVDDSVIPSEENEEKLENADVPVQKPEKPNETKKKNESQNKQQHPDGDVLDEVQEVEVDGEVVETMTVPRGNETTYHTQYENLRKMSAVRLTIQEMNAIRSEVELQLSAWHETPSDAEADKTWQKITSVTSSLAQDLSEQLRLVLEPTLASRLKGDFRTGRRINMRKVIPYIASEFRKDKIWLRRTKPSKREYQIVLAIDDSSSMADNHSKELAFESVALISKALTLLESGQLSVVSFGETTEILHKLSDQFTDRSGVKLLQKFRFDQNKTCIAKLVDFVSEMFGQCQMQATTALNAKLLVIVSDGRGVFSEGEAYVRQAVRRARLCNIFMVFVLIDNPENKHSILDIRMPVFKDGKFLAMQNYMDVFPFSFYIILRDINSLPNVLSDALRQWFEVVSNLDKQ